MAQFAITYDYLCPFARIANEIVIRALDGGARALGNVGERRQVQHTLAELHGGADHEDQQARRKRPQAAGPTSATAIAASSQTAGSCTIAAPSRRASSRPRWPVFSPGCPEETAGRVWPGWTERALTATGQNEAAPPEEGEQLLHNGRIDRVGGCPLWGTG
jgi:hypothetical protein